MSTQHARPVPREEYPWLSKSERRYVGTLQRRLNYLCERLSSNDHSEGAGSFIAAEAAAIEWALKIVIINTSETPTKVET